MRVENVVNINAVFLDIHKHNESNLHTHPLLVSLELDCCTSVSQLSCVAEQSSSPEVVLVTAVFPDPTAVGRLNPSTMSRALVPPPTSEYFRYFIVGCFFNPSYT